MVFLNNCGEGKLYPGGPTCDFRGKKVPCFIRWNEKGGMTSDILTEALKRMDHLELFFRTNNCKQMLLVDGYGSRFGLNLLEYINNTAHLWTVCIGLTYDTELW